MSRKNLLPGILLILLGLFFLLRNLGWIRLDLSSLWPLILVVIGLSFEFSYFTGGGHPGLLVPGGILTTYGLLFLAVTFFPFFSMQHLWPLFLLGPAVGLFQLYLFGGRERGVMIAASILSGLGLIFLSLSVLSLSFTFLVPLLLIGVGLLIIFAGRKS